MTATLMAERRRALPTPPRPLRELPVLFHLMDVSRPKGYAAGQSSFFKLEAPDDPYGSHSGVLVSPPPAAGAVSTFPADVAGDDATVPPQPSGSFDLETAAELVQTKAYGSLPSEAPPLAGGPGSAHNEPARVLPEGSQALAADAAADEPNSATRLDAPGPTGDTAVTLRERAEQRMRKRQEAKKEDWFRTQGKFILVGFFIALAVTIYVARSGRKPAARPPVAARQQSPAPAVAGTANKSSAVKQAAAVEPAKITSVRPTAKTVATSEPKTALHPPTIPQLPSESTAASSPADATLFTFTRRTEERVAARSDDQTAASPASAAPPGPSPALTPEPNPPAPATPTLQPQYPATNYPSQYQPPAVGTTYAPPSATYAPPAAAYAPPPATYAPPAATYAPPPATYAPPAAPTGPALGPAASTMPLYPTTNTASGYRYERTGSSVY